jgi:hypothetical protein
MNIVEAIRAMRQGRNVRRNSWEYSVSLTWLSISKVLPDDHDPDEECEEKDKIEVIFFNIEAITKEHEWVGVYPEIRNKWTPSQECILSDDWIIVDRVEIPPRLDLWMQGAKFGTIIKIDDYGYATVRMDHPQVTRKIRVHLSELKLIDPE